MNATETEQLAALNKRVFDGETLNDQQESLRKELAALRSQQGKYMYSYLSHLLIPHHACPFYPPPHSPSRLCI
jgi:hypothetical protein